MAVATSPLRYPGGKLCMLDTVAEVLRLNKLQRHHYAEPYAGGCGLALALLYEGHVSEIHVNDIDPSIWSFWHCVLNETDSFIEKIEQTPVTMDEWYKQKEVLNNFDKDNVFDLGFATFFLNRTNRSGIIKNAGMIGGFSQNGTYKLDCRYNKEGLINRIRRIHKYRKRIHLYNLDAVDFLKKAESDLPEKSFYCIDPPYFNKGSSLYTSFYNPEDHAELSQAALELKHPWIITYDNAEEIKELYTKRRHFEFNLNYSLQEKRMGTEILIASKGLKIPKAIKMKQLHKYNKAA